MPVSSNVRHRKHAPRMLATNLNRPAFARLEYTHPGFAGVRSAIARCDCKKLGAHRRRKATVGSPRSAGQRSVMREREATERPPTSYPAKARPPSHGGRAPVLRLHPIGKPNESANCSPGRQELQGNSVHCSIGNTGAHSSRAPGLARSGWVVAKLLTRPPSQIKTAMPNHSLNRTFCGGPRLG